MPDRSGWDRRPGFKLAGKKALVVGVETPPGAAVARAFSEAGASVAAVAATSPANVDTAYADTWDVTDPAAVDAGFARLRQGFGAPTIVVTAQDAPVAAPIDRTDDDTYRRVMSVVADGAYYVCRAFMRALPSNVAHARIICLTTVFGERGVDDLTAYAAAHGAVHNLVRALAQEAGGRNGGTANAIAIGWMTYTPGRGPDDIGQNRLMRFVPMRRFGEPDEAGPLAVLLASEAAGYISGQVLHIDGGITTHL